MVRKMWLYRPWHYSPYRGHCWWIHWYPITPDEEIELLKDYKRRLELELQYVNERISELEKRKAEKQ